ncbi:MAG TPA: HNH endonuclease signature motif containing protein, partial [Jatrophihabitans sp.]|nr:HNH endonuclease signature motif containing protein [Jatrophihabitans sp.]
RRHSQLAFQTCLFPGCRRPATDCDQDHRRDHARGGRTEAGNLAPGCGHDHDLKTRRGWRLTRRTQHTYLWTSPLGRRHLVQVPPIAPPLPPPQLRPPDPDTDPDPDQPDHPSAHAHAYDDVDGSNPSTFSPLTQRGRPLRPALTDPEPLTPPDPPQPEPPEPDPDPPPF